MRVREARTGDADRIASLHVASWNAAHRGLVSDRAIASRTLERRERYWRQSLARRTDPVVVLVATIGSPDEESVGFAAIEGHAPTFEISCLYVSPEHFRCGVGTGLLLQAEGWMRAHGGTAAQLHVVASNRRARAFYEHAGWVRSAHSVRDDEELQAPVMRYERRLAG
jgi:ribosomal protein S18 acetylase RimI-like enzyme